MVIYGSAAIEYITYPQLFPRSLPICQNFNMRVYSKNFIVALGSNNVSICASLGTHAYLCVQQKVCWHTSPMRTIKMLHSSMLTCITHVCSRSYISHVGMLEHSILIAPMGQHTRGFQEQNYYVMYFIKFTWFQLQNKMFHISLHTWIRPHITGWCKSA